MKTTGTNSKLDYLKGLLPFKKRVLQTAQEWTELEPDNQDIRDECNAYKEEYDYLVQQIAQLEQSTD